MKPRSWIGALVSIFAMLLAGSVSPRLSAAATAAEPDKAQITLLYDAFGTTSDMQKDWGSAAFIEYGGKRILVDTGNNADIFAHNVKAKGIDLAVTTEPDLSIRHNLRWTDMLHAGQSRPMTLFESMLLPVAII